MTLPVSTATVLYSCTRHSQLMVDLDAYDDEQARLMQEMCLLTDLNDVVIGFDTKKNCHLMTEIAKGKLHRAFSVFLFNEKNELLLQQRSDEKITFPGYFTNTCCSHPLAVTSEMDEVGQMGVRTAAQRKLNHELGIPASQVHVDDLKFLTRIHYLAPSDDTWGEHEIDYIFILKPKHMINLNPSPNEVKSTIYVSKAQLQDMFKNNEILMTPWFRLIVENFLYKWWDNLDDLSAFKDTKTIHRML